ncbi:MAG: hypothetical protein LRZ85_03340 [Alphaproteobacteria bacterium]|nr:hypothetical protein [Alphaproteobacteria bacterium]
MRGAAAEGGYGKIVVSPTGRAVQVQTAQEMLRSVKNITTLSNMTKQESKIVSDWPEPTKEQIDAVRAAAVIGVRHAMEDVAAIRAEVFGTVNNKAPATDADDAIGQRATNKLDPEIS